MAAMVAKAILLAVTAALVVQLAAAVDHPVGGDGSWDASGANYNAWAAQQKIKQGDSISFKYTPSHDVVEVTKAGYDACSGSNPVKSYTGGSSSVKLTTPGKHYFICSVPGHCASGMKLEVTVAAAGAAAPAPTKSKPRHQRTVAPTPAPAEEAPAPAGSSSTTEDSTPTGAPAPRSSDAASVGMLGAKAVMGLAAGVAMVMAM